VPIPEGSHRLSLYFVNDHSYYEPSRVHTVAVFDGTGGYQTGTEVRWFVNGVYKQFGVAGPCTLRVLISRDLSLNVLLAGVFLDPLTDPSTTRPRKLPGGRAVQEAWAAWDSARTKHLSSEDERTAFLDAVAAARHRGTRQQYAGSWTASRPPSCEPGGSARRRGPSRPELTT
jgi:hypothetical protein